MSKKFDYEQALRAGEEELDPDMVELMQGFLAFVEEIPGDWSTKAGRATCTVIGMLRGLGATDEEVRNLVESYLKSLQQKLELEEPQGELEQRAPKKDMLN